MKPIIIKIIFSLIEVLLTLNKDIKDLKEQGLLDEGTVIVHSKHQTAYPVATDRVGPVHGQSSLFISNFLPPNQLWYPRGRHSPVTSNVTSSNLLTENVNLY